MKRISNLLIVLTLLFQYAHAYAEFEKIGKAFTSFNSRSIAAIPKIYFWDKKAPSVKERIKQAKKSIIVAVIDTGIDYNHKDIKNKIWINSAEDKDKDGICTKADFDGIDQDSNGYVDDCMGWNFPRNNNQPMDTHGHGTHIAGVIATISKSFPEYDIKIMPLKYYDEHIHVNHIKNTVNAINYAVKMGASVINYSAGGDVPSKEEKTAIQAAEKSGVLFVAAAGNETNNVGKVPYYPSSYNLPNIFSVTAIDKSGKLLKKSNWGMGIDIAAPGYKVLSTLPQNRYGSMSGTSMAASFITGLISVIMASTNCSAYAAVKLIKESAIQSKILKSKVIDSKKVNPEGALRSIAGKQTTGISKIQKIFSQASIL